MTNQISDWPPITADLRADGSLELVVAGMGNHFQDTDETTARHAALEHVHELAVNYARPLRVRTSSAGSATGSLIVAPDGTFWAEDDPSTVWPLSALSTTTAAAAAPADTDMATSLFELGTPAPSRPRAPRRRPTAAIVAAGAALAVLTTGAIAIATTSGGDAPKPVAATTATPATVATTAPTTATPTLSPPQLAVRVGKPARGTATLRITSDGAAQTVRVTITHPRRRAEVYSVVVAHDSSVRLKVELKPGRYRWAVTPAEGDALTGRLRVLAPKAKPKKKVTTPPVVRTTPPPAPPRSGPAPKPNPKPAPKPRPKPAPKPKKPPIGDIPDGPIGD